MAVTDLQTAVRQRRGQLGLSLEAAAKQGWISKGTIHEIESGRRNTFTPKTLAGLDKAMDWEPGTADRIVHGDVAQPAPLSIAAAARGQAMATVTYHTLAEGVSPGLSYNDLEHILKDRLLGRIEELDVDQLADVQRYIDHLLTIVEVKKQNARLQAQLNAMQSWLASDSPDE